MPIGKEIPWCTCFLVLGAFTCQTAVLIGNYKTASSIGLMGTSVKGWSGVGLATSLSLHAELDEVMTNVSEQLTDAINRTMKVQDTIDGLLSMMGVDADDTAEKAKTLLLQMNGSESGDPMGDVMGVIMQSFGALPNFQVALDTLEDMLFKLKPALLQVGQWVVSFGDQVQATVETFGTTLDRVQKIFDNLMAQMSSSAGEGADLMMHDTFNLFDVDGDGFISADDLDNCASLYGVSAIKGKMAASLVKRHDADGSKSIDTKEFEGLVSDSDIPGIMATVLRAYSKRLSQVAGNVAAGRMRDEVATTVVKYFQLVCSKNLTKVGWVSQMLTNGTLPLAFTADIMVELSLLSDDPDILTTADVGQIVIGTMMTLDAEYTMQAVELMSSAEHWTSEGFNPDDQAGVVKQVTKWTVSGPDAVDRLQKVMVDLVEEPGQKGANAHTVLLDVINAMPAAAGKLAEQRMRAHQKSLTLQKRAKRLSRFGTAAQQTFLVKLLGGIAASDGGSPERAKATLNKGQPAAPETLLFAKWLSQNASATGNRFQKQCFDFTGQSSSPLDAFNTQIQGMVKKISGFIDMMKEYSTPYGVDQLEKQVADFAVKAMDDVFQIVKDQVMNLIDNAFNQVEDAKDKAKESVSKGLSLSGVREERSDRDARVIRRLQDHWAANAKQPKGAAAKAAKGAKDDPGAAAAAAKAAKDDPKGAAATAAGDFVPSGVWVQVTELLRELTNVLPTALETMKFARKEVSAVASTLDSLFGTLEEKGAPIFDNIAAIWKIIWLSYFLFIAPISLIILFYGFWASGWFGGPQATKEMEGYEPPQTLGERCKICCDSCFACLRSCHDRQLCFWSFIIVFQVIVLLIFIMSVVFCIIAGVQIFVGSGCAQIYLLGDDKVCTETLNQLAVFMPSYQVNGGAVPLSMTCEHYNLKTCDIVQDKMLASAMMTVAGSFIAAVFSFQMIFDTALLHERARYRRMMDEMGLIEREEVTDEKAGEGGFSCMSYLPCCGSKAEDAADAAGN